MGSFVVQDALLYPPCTDIDIVRVRPRCGFQTADARFGRGAGARMMSWLTSHSDPETNHDDGEQAPNSDIEAYDGYDEDGRVMDSAHDATGTTGMTCIDSPPVPSQQREPPRVARGRLGLTALSQRYNLFFAAYSDKIHVYRPQQAPEILHGALLVLCPQPTKEAGRIGGYVSTTVPHQVNHMIVGDLGNLEILLLAFDDGDVVGYYTHQIVGYLADANRGHPTLSPAKPRPFFRETVGLSAWGLAIHTKSRLIAVSSNLAEVTVFSPALCNRHMRKHIERGEPVGPWPDSMAQSCTVHTSSHAAVQELRAKLRRRDRNWRILLPLGQGGTNIPSIAFADDSKGRADMVLATDINGYVWFLSIWKVGYPPLQMRAGLANEQFSRGWGILPIPKYQFAATRTLPRRAPEVLCRERNFLTHGLNYSLVTDPTAETFSLMQSSNTTYTPDDDDDDLDRYCPGKPYTMRMLLELNSSTNTVGVGEADANADAYVSDTDSDFSQDELAYDSDDDSNACDMAFCTLSDEEDDERRRGIAPKVRQKTPFAPVELEDGFNHAMIACPGTCQTWPTPEWDKLVRLLRHQPLRHMAILGVTLTVPDDDDDDDDSDLDDDDYSDDDDDYDDDNDGPASASHATNPSTAAQQQGAHAHTGSGTGSGGHAHTVSVSGGAQHPDLAQYSKTGQYGYLWNDLRHLDKKYVLFQTLSTCAQLFSPCQDTPVYGVRHVTKLLATETTTGNGSLGGGSGGSNGGMMVDMTQPYYRCSMVHFIAELNVLVVGRLQGQVVLLRPLRNTDPEPARRRHRTTDPVRAKLAAVNYTPYAFRTEWTLPLQKDKADPRFPSCCCLLGIAVSPVPETGAGRYGMAAEGVHCRPKTRAARMAPRQWRLIMHYMDHTVLQYYISKDGPDGALRVLKEMERDNNRRQREMAMSAEEYAARFEYDEC